MSQAGNSNRITRNYLDSLLIETRYMNSAFADASFELFGKKFSTPILICSVAVTSETSAKSGHKTFLGRTAIVA